MQFFNFFLNMKTTQKTLKQKFPPQKNLSWGMTHPPTSEFFSDFFQPELLMRRDWMSLPGRIPRFITITHVGHNTCSIKHNSSIVSVLGNVGPALLHAKLKNLKNCLI